jgi:hypothetical protein
VSAFKTTGTLLAATREDFLLRRIAEASAVEAMQACGSIDPAHATEDAYEVALRAASIAVARMMNEGDGLAALKAERDHFKEVAIRLSGMEPPRPILISARINTEKE